MALTDNTATFEELDSALTANPALAVEIEKAITKRGGYLAPDAAKKTEYETNIAKATKSSLTSEIALKNEAMMFELTGVKKTDPNKKWYDYQKEVVESLSTLSKTQAAELTRLKGSTDLTAAERQRITELEALSTSRGAEIETLKNTHQSELQQAKAENKIFLEIGKVDAKMKKDIDPELLSMKRDAVIEEMKKSSKFDGGKLVFFGQDGKALTNADASFKTAEQVYSEKMVKYIDSETTGGAGGADASDKNGPVGQFKTQQELDVFLSSKGFLQGTPEFTKEAKRLGREKLPLQ